MAYDHKKVLNFLFRESLHDSENIKLQPTLSGTVKNQTLLGPK